MSESNVFIIVNLGCEMLYVIEQRLKAQKICLEKSTQVMRDITSVLLDSKFIDRIMLGNERKKILTSEHCKIILQDIVCCSLMRLDEKSMNKLWDLITMIFKWQLFVTKQPQHLLDITFRHLDGIAKIYPDVKKTIFIDYIKNKILDYWNINSLQIQYDIYNTIILWLSEFNVKISILIRLGFQNIEGKFIKNVQEIYYQDFIDNIGDNIFDKTSKIDEIESKEWINNSEEECCGGDGGGNKDKFENFANQLNVIKINDNDNNKNELDFLIHIKNDDPDLNDTPTTSNYKNNELQNQQQQQFVQVKIAHNSTNSASLHSWENLIGRRTGGNSSGERIDLKTLLNKEF